MSIYSAKNDLPYHLQGYPFKDHQIVPFFGESLESEPTQPKFSIDVGYLNRNENVRVMIKHFKLIPIEKPPDSYANKPN